MTVNGQVLFTGGSQALLFDGEMEDKENRLQKNRVGIKANRSSEERDVESRRLKSYNLERE
jgi:hypothetical protein